MVAVHVAAAQVGPGPLVVQHLTAPQAGEGQRVEAHGALGPARIQLLPQRFQVLYGGRAGQALGRAPQEGGAAQVDERAVDQLLGLCLQLDGGEEGAGGHLDERSSLQHYMKYTEHVCCFITCLYKHAGCCHSSHSPHIFLFYIY